jgi:acetoin utilization protein AcuB
LLSWLGKDEGTRTPEDEMLVNDWMNTPVITIEAQDPLDRAAKLMTEHKIDLLPVLSMGALVGVLTDLDLKRAAPSEVMLIDAKDLVYQLSKLKVEGVMTRDPVTIQPDYTIEEAAELLRAHNISGCPVIDRSGQLVGVITKNDIFRSMVVTTGMSKRGIQFGFMVQDRPGTIKELTDVIRKYHARLVSVLTSYEKAPLGYRFVYIRVFNVNRDHLAELKRELSETAKLLYMVDLRDNVRETYASY